jgi:hypothetical protein
MLKLTGSNFGISNAGSAAAPSLFFAGNSTGTDTGFYSYGNNRVGFSAKGTNVATIDSTGMALAGLAACQAVGVTTAGTAAAPSMYFSAQGTGTDTGIYVTGANALGVAAGGSNIITIDSTGITINGVVYGGFKQNTITITTADSTLVAAQSGSSIVAITIDAKRTVTLPAAVAGMYFDFVGSDTDSLKILPASGDSVSTGGENCVLSPRGIATASAYMSTMGLRAINDCRWVGATSSGSWVQY